MQMEMENIDFKGEKRARKMEINPLGAIALPTWHLLKERLISNAIPEIMDLSNFRLISLSVGYPRCLPTALVTSH
jgi:hypothetical protein